MKNLIVLMAVLCLIFTSCDAQPKEKTSQIEGQSLLWQISGNGLEKPSYLFGTIHLIPKEDFFLPTGTTTALESTDALVMEIDMDIPIKEQLAMAPKMLIPENKTLAHYLSDEEYSSITNYMIDSIGLSEKKVEKYMHFRPFYLTGIVLTEALGKVESYEKYFAALAKKQNKNFIALESIYFQLDLIDSVSIEEQVESYLETDLKNEFYTLLNCYTNQDLKCMQELMEEDDDENFEKVFLTQRNTNWVGKLTGEILHSQSSFIAVGAAHLGGDKGLIKLLQDKGYTVTPVIQ